MLNPKSIIVDMAGAIDSPAVYVGKGHLGIRD